MAKDPDYAEMLDELDAQLEAGEITKGKHAILRQDILADARPVSGLRRVVYAVVTLAIGWIIMLVIFNIAGGM